MATYILLINWTDAGVKAVSETVDRYEAARGQFEQLGVTLREIYWTVGPYDIVGVADAPDDETATAAALALNSQGNVRTTTLRAFDPNEMRGIIGRIG
jgi:uncharacterized protein with GYD domain